MSLRSWLSAAMILGVLLLASACAEPPTKELDQAQGAIETAKAAGADQFAPEEIRAAADALTRAHAAVEQRDFRQALSLALDAKERARDAARSAAERMAQRRSEAEQAIENAQRALAVAEQRLASPAEARLPPPQHATLTADLKTAARSLQEARAALGKQAYQEARASADTALTRIREAMTTLGDAQNRSRRPAAGRRP
jgi:hypothetical protein